ncbi:hypothetical protein B0T21DRAFT_289517, partial [Apiosordaria backusii]
FNNYLIKGFIKLSTFLIITLVLIIKKPNREIYIYIDYYSFNNIIVKNRYLIFFIKKILNTLYKVKYFFKLNITIVFNCLYIAFNNK